MCACVIRLSAFLFNGVVAVIYYLNTTLKRAPIKWNSSTADEKLLADFKSHTKQRASLPVNNTHIEQQNMATKQWALTKHDNMQRLAQKTSMTP